MNSRDLACRGIRALTFVAAFVNSAIASAGASVWTTSGPPGGASSVITESRTPGVVYAGTPNGLFRSGDGGATWASAGLQGLAPTPLAVGAPGTVFATLSYGYPSQATLYRSFDSGATWVAIPLEADSYFDLSVDLTTPSTLYRVNHTTLSPGGSLVCSLFRSTDSGSTWTKIELPSFDPFESRIYRPAVDPFSPGTVYVAAYQPPTSPVAFGFSRIYKSVDSGMSWTILANARVGMLTADPGTPGTIYCAELGLAKSLDGGRTFSTIADGTFSALVIDPLRPKRMYAVRNGHVSRSADAGVTWVSMGIDWLYGIEIAIDSTGTFLHAAGGSLGVYDYQFVSDPNALALDPGRSFSVTLVATDQRTGDTGPGLPIPVSDIFGYFSIPAITGNPGNPEVFVKMLDGTSINGGYWFFYGGLTDLEYTLTVTDNVTGNRNTYTKLGGSECGGSDTAAFVP